jgi:Carboxypeptidase regulatory-like domain
MRRIAALIVALSAAALTPAAQTPSPPPGRGVISGRVVDTFGDPVINARIVVETRSGENTTPGVAASETDDRGEYRIGRLPSGSYLVSLLRLQVTAPR